MHVCISQPKWLNVVPNKNYTRGRALEYKIRDDLYHRGCGLVIRAAGSHGVVDLCGFGMRGGPLREQILFVQSKLNGKCSRDERMRLYDAALDVGAIPLIASPGKRGEGIKYEVVTCGGDTTPWEFE